MKKWSDTDRQLQIIRQTRAEKSKERDVSVKGTVSLHYSRELNFLRSMAPARAASPSSRFLDVIFKVPEVFSLIENPEQTLEFISSVSSSDSNLVRSILLDHGKVKSHDLGAEILLGVAVKHLKERAGYRNVHIRVRGIYPDSDRRARLIRSMGVVKKLNIEHRSTRDDLAHLEIFDFAGQKDHETNLGAEDRKNRCARKFVDHLNNCLSHAKRKLADTAVQDLLDFVGEIIGNAEDHSGETRWSVSGYLDDDVEQDMDETRFCEIVIYNFGMSIADTFSSLNQQSYGWSIVEPYVRQHQKKGFFGHNWLVEDLLTLVALQGHVSSKNTGAETDRGQGTVDLIEFFQEVASECASGGIKNARMALISGKTHILFDDVYRIKRDERGRDIIAFNHTNDLNEKPDQKYVRHMRGVKFPGTLIAIKFPVRVLETEVVEPQVETEK